MKACSAEHNIYKHRRQLPASTNVSKPCNITHTHECFDDKCSMFCCHISIFFLFVLRSLSMRCTLFAVLNINFSLLIFWILLLCTSATLNSQKVHKRTEQNIALGVKSHTHTQIIHFWNSSGERTERAHFTFFIRERNNLKAHCMGGFAEKYEWQAGRIANLFHFISGQRGVWTNEWNGRRLRRTRMLVVVV